MKTLYVKDSGNRKRQFSLTTRICSDKKKKFVVKKPCFSEGIIHIEKITNSQKIFKKYFPDIAINKTWIENDMLFAEFIEGAPLSDYYIKAINDKNKEELIEIMKYHLNILLGKNNNCIFKETDDFKKIFIETEVFKDEPALLFTNYETSPENIIFLNNNKNKPCFIDYEWFFDFPVPVSLLKYRLANQVSKYIGINDVISLNERLDVLNCKLPQNIGDKIDINFFNYVFKEKKINYLTLYKNYEKEIQQYPFIFNIHLLFDTGNGYSDYEKNTYIKTGNYVNIECILPKNIKSIKLIPVKGYGCCINDLEIKTNNKKIKYEIINGYYEENNIIFTSNDPQIEMLNIKDYININYKIFIIPERSYLEIINDYIRKNIKKNEHIIKINNEFNEIKSELNDTIGELNNTISELNGELNNKIIHIEQLIVSERTLNGIINGIYSSKAWKIGHGISLIGNKILPKFSKRRLFVKIIYEMIKHPLRTFLKINPKRIFKFFRVLKTEGTSEVSRRIDNINIPEYNKNLNLIEDNVKDKEIKDYEKILFKNEENPIVSIIIPVYNQFNFTYNCLKSIINNSGKEIAYEIIIADDCSNDFTKDINNVISNIKVIQTKKNVRFLKNCNNAAKFAKGKYILFLNNDTQVQENWLKPLVELVERDEKIGAVGSKLVYDNGKLQEAGGILWEDASAWNYGRMGEPDMPEYNYVKEADYISGASLMIKKSLWDELNGFDENFAPAYCEDSDICFSIRKLGYKVMYQPMSVVVHFEGITNGTNEKEGQKKYQVINQDKFREKWNSVLHDEHFINGENVFYARDRSKNKKTLLFIDHYVPHYDKDAGSRATFQYLQLFNNLGFNIKFIGDNFFKHEPYTTELEQMGIEVLYGNYYYKNWLLWLKSNGIFIDYVIISRPHISIKYIDIIKKYTKAKIFYFGHDLHFLREQREYEINNNRKLLSSISKFKEMEFNIMKKADVSYYFSYIEIDIIKNINSLINCKVIPLNIYKNVIKKKFEFKNKKDLIFVGGFSHNPNIDAIEWLVKSIFPSIIKAIPEIKLYVIGSNPTEKIKKLENNYIKILGYVDDKTLIEYYNNCKVCVVPLRYGAGVKGKIIEAMYNQIPVITTSIGAEGLHGIDNCLIIEDNPEKFADKLIKMYNDKDILTDLIESSYQYINEHFSEKSVIKIIKEDFKVERSSINV